MNTLTTVPHLRHDEFSVTLTEGGDIRQIRYQDIMINQLIHHPFNESLMNLYVRHDASAALPLLGIHSPSRLAISEHTISWKGEYETFGYEVVASLHTTGMHFKVSFIGEGEFDVTYAQDLGLADEAGVRTNEAYMAQYIDYVATEHGVLARQNQRQSTGFPSVAILSHDRIEEFATDGFDVYGTSYRATNMAKGLHTTLPSRILQYEFALPTIRTVVKESDGEIAFQFELRFIPSMEEALDEQSIHQFMPLFEREEERKGHHRTTFLQTPKTLVGKTATTQQLDDLYPERLLEEWEGSQLLSFFTPNGHHVVLKEKELLVDRSHATILLNGGSLAPLDKKLATTVHMNGVFNSHIVHGNTNYNKWTSNVRNPLNIPKTSGQRIYIARNEEYQLLTLPSIFEMGWNEVVWYYFVDEETIEIRTSIGADRPVLETTVKTLHPHAMKISHQVTMHTQEYDVPFQMEQDGNRLHFRATDDTLSKRILPHLTYTIEMDQPYSIAQTSDWLTQPIVDDLVWLSVEATDHLVMRMGTEEQLFFEAEKEKLLFKKWQSHYRKNLQFEDVWQDADALQFQVDWYIQNMRIHYQSPHGLEQYGGAAWGTRDVSQGPMEFLLAFGHFEEARALLLRIFSHQFETGHWPQWFMFDEYAGIQQEDSHGDVIVWPLKACADYLQRTHDWACLEELLPYRTETGQETLKHSLMNHLERACERIEKDFVPNSVFSAYGGGDWDDTLQPADDVLKKKLISTWTVALTFQAFRNLAIELPESTISMRLTKLALRMEQSFQSEMILEGVIPGFLRVEEDGYHPMIHPSDDGLPMKYRLLPLTRSIIGELVTREQAMQNLRIIEEHLKFPDGVRLMDRPAQYRGGVSRHFMRAEQAANVGREIGLQYVHAHIRYIEALAKFGADEKTITEAFDVINPVDLKVPKAVRRQRNAYFSSSDAAFTTRYEAQERWSELKAGKVPVKGGWRIYSSGPGIWLNQLMTNVLGIQERSDGLLLDPVITGTFQMNIFDIPCRIRISRGEQRRVLWNGELIKLSSQSNRYRQGGHLVQREALKTILPTGNELQIELPH